MPKPDDLFTLILHRKGVKEQLEIRIHPDAEFQVGDQGITVTVRQRVWHFQDNEALEYDSGVVLYTVPIGELFRDEAAKRNAERITVIGTGALDNPAGDITILGKAAIEQLKVDQPDA